MTDCSALPTVESTELFDQDAGTINEVVTSPNSYTENASDGKPKKTLAGIADDASSQLASQESTFQNRFAFSQPTLPWSASTLISDPLQLYSTGTIGESGYSVWLADPALLPFTTSATFAEDEALGRWAVAVVATQDFATKVATDQAVARSVNTQNANVGSDEAGEQVKPYIYSDGQEKTYLVPEVAQGKIIDTVIGDQLTTTEPKTYTLINAVEIDAPITVKVPSEYLTLQSALDAVSPISYKQGATITLLIDTGHQVDSGIACENGDYGRFIVSSVDAVLPVSAAFNGRFISGNHCTMPVLDCYVDGALGTLDRVYSAINSLGEVTTGSGGENITGRPLYANNSFIRAGSTEWRDFGDSIYGSAGAGIQLGSAIVEGGTVTSNGCIIASRGASIEAQNLTFKDCSSGFECKRAGAAINAHEATIENIGPLFLARASRGGIISLSEAVITGITGAGIEAIAAGVISLNEGATMTAAPGNASIGIKATNNGRADLGDGTIDGFGSFGIECRSGGVVSGENCFVLNSGSHGIFAHSGGKALMPDATVTGSGGNDVRIQEGGEVNIKGGTTTSGPVGTPNVIDTNVNGFGGFDVIASGGRGILWG